MRVRRATDLDVVVDLDNECFTDDDQVRPRDGGAWWVATDDGRPVGYSGGRVWERDGGVFIIERQGVIPEARGHGLQRRFIRAALNYAKREGLSSVWSYTAHWNVHSSNNFIRTGFVLWSPSHWGGVPNPAEVVEDGAGWLYWKRDLHD